MYDSGYNIFEHANENDLDAARARDDADRTRHAVRGVSAAAAHRR